MWSNENSRTSFDSQHSVTSRQLTTSQTPTPVSNQNQSQALLNYIRSPASYYDEEEEAATVVEYEWPKDSGKAYFIEEYLANYLGMKSLRRQYPKVGRRRVVAVEEREYLLNLKLVSTLQCDLGVIAVFSDEVYKYVAPAFKRKFEIYDEVKRAIGYDEMLEEMWKLSNSRNMLTSENLKTETMKACASWNGSINQCTRKFRSKYIDTQTGNVHKKHITPEIHPATPKVGYFPVMVLPGQYVDHFKRYTREELQHLPLNTVLTGHADKFMKTYPKKNLKRSNNCNPSVKKPRKKYTRTLKIAELDFSATKESLKISRATIPNTTKKSLKISRATIPNTTKKSVKLSRATIPNTTTSSSRSSDSLFELVVRKKN